MTKTSTAAACAVAAFLVLGWVHPSDSFGLLTTGGRGVSYNSYNNKLDYCYCSTLSPSCGRHRRRPDSNNVCRHQCWRTELLSSSSSSPEDDDTAERRLGANNDDDDDDDDNNNNRSNHYANEETLLCLDLAVVPGVTYDAAWAHVSKFCQSFPFAAVLPVQPLHYLPVYEDGGVQVKFLRKKTGLKSAVDGGVRFFLHGSTTKTSRYPPQQQQQLPKQEDDDDDDDDDEEEKDTEATTVPTTRASRIKITVKRNSRGQTFTKLMAEKLIVTNFVAAITGEPETRKRLGSPPVEDYVRVRSIYHKWM